MSQVGLDSIEFYPRNFVTRNCSFPF